jgi:sulfate adenylyltransferase subunit 1 (EFTu-like GTPase family)
VTTSTPIVFDPYSENRTTGSFVLIDPTTNFTAGAGMISHAVRQEVGKSARASASERLAEAARGAATDDEATEAVRRLLEEILT